MRAGCRAVKVTVSAKLDALFADDSGAAAIAHVLEVSVTRSDWNDSGPATGPSHPYRSLQPAAVGGLPCLVKYGPGGAAAKLTEGELLDATALARLFAPAGAAEPVAQAADAGSWSCALGATLPSNPAGAIAYQLAQAAGLLAMPHVELVHSGGGLAFCMNYGDYEKMKGLSSVTVFGVPVEVSG